MDPEWKVTQEDLHKYLDVLLVLVKECGDIISDAITKRVNVEIDEKVENVGEGNSSAILTETDLKVEKHLINGLKAKFSDHQFIGEESSGDDKVGRELGNAPTWIIDPIDGTMNFVHSNPLVCTSIGLTVNKKLMIGVVNCPLIGKLYSAVRGEGAYCNGNRIRVSKASDISKAMIIMELPAGANKDKKSVALSNLEYILENAHAARAPGPAALDIAWVGSGSADGFFHQGIHSWDMAAGALIVKEAGGTVMSPNGGEFDLMSRGIIVASSRTLAEQISGFIKIYSTPRDQDTPCYPF
ncbi:inositol monophosphatase 1 [Eurytemora carolleeae]|uniref:inositol monophosphatase 1 n=1 Tax=Eurytemora carolleeae TaxID=1294199 RepID=UPI000C75B8C9|nr:inositol monophosphatase 1 [Eurytemora carolleeae]|eukprot:XP_023321544.1 inositol monophosphatase 1-like [Eurytemora affinis]